LNSESKPRCPGCGGSDTRRSRPGGVLDSMMLTLGRSPYRCRCCERRFYIHDTPSAPAAEPPV